MMRGRLLIRRYAEKNEEQGSTELFGVLGMGDEGIIVDIEIPKGE